MSIKFVIFHLVVLALAYKVTGLPANEILTHDVINTTKTGFLLDPITTEIAPDTTTVHTTPKTTTAATTITTTTTSPTTTTATTTTITPTTNATTTVVPPTNATTTTVAPTTTSVKPTLPTNATTTVAPKTTIEPATSPITPTTEAPPDHGRFDGASFLGGIILTCGLLAISFVAYKFYKSRTERNYHTL